MLDIISIAADLLADMPEFQHLSYYSDLPRLYKGGDAMTRYTRLMQVEETPLLLLGNAPDVPDNALPATEAHLRVYAGGISWSGDNWESYIIPPEILERIAGRQPS